jgi:hypothetical protein
VALHQIRTKSAHLTSQGRKALEQFFQAQQWVKRNNFLENFESFMIIIK